MKRTGQNLAVVALVAVASVGAAACGSSSSKSSAKAPAASTPATPSTPSTTTTAAATGPLTKAKVVALQQPLKALLAALSAANSSHNAQAIAAASSKTAAAYDAFANQLGALKAPSAAAAKLQQKTISLAKQGAALFDQLAKAASTGDANAAKALAPKFTALQQEFNAIGVQLDAAIP